MSTASDELLGLLVAETTDYAILMLDAQGHVTTWNAGAERFKGYRAQEIIGRHYSVFYPPEDVAAGKPGRALAIAEREGRWEDEGWRVRKDGSRFWASAVITALRDSTGELRGFGKVTRDLTERRRAELAVREREQLMSGVLAAATECSIIGTDLEGTITVFNRGAERMLGYLAHELVGIATPAVIHEPGEVAARALELGIAPGFGVFVAAAREGGADARDWTYVRKDGSRLPVQLTVTAILDESGQPRGFIGVAVDLSERRRAQAEIQAADAEAAIMEKVFTDAPVGVALLDLKGRFLRVNAAVCEILGRSEPEIVGMRSEAFAHPDDVTATVQGYARIMAGGPQMREERRYLRPDGQVVWVSATGTVLRSIDGCPTHLVTHLRNVTGQRLLEENLRASEANLRNVAALARGLPSHGNPRRAICEAAALIARADVVQLWEPDGADLRVTAATGVELSEDFRVPIVGELSGTASTYRSEVRHVVLDTSVPGVLVSARMRERLGAASALYEPVVGPNGPLGVLVVLWRTAITEAADRDVEAVGLLATEAAAAIERADQSARLRAQVEKDERRLRQLLEGAPDATIIADTDGIIQIVNDRALLMFGYNRAELAGLSIDQLIPEARHAGNRAVIERDLTAGRKDGSEIPVSITLSPVETDDAVLVVAAVRDITERRAEQARVRAAEEQFRRAFGDAPIGMCITGLDGRFIKVNDAFCEIVGHPRTTLMGLARQSITHPDDVAQDDGAAQELLAGTVRTFTREKRYLHATGHPVWCSLSVSLIRDEDGKPVHFITQVQDVTERRRYEHQLRLMADHDPLTGLLNRRSFERELTSHVARVKRSGPVGAVLMVDLDNFKYYNDSQGHSAGDDLIVRIGQALQSRLRESDVLARLGGDEFAVLLPEQDSDGAAIVADALLEVIRNEAPAPIHGEQRRVTGSVGIACFSDGDRLTGEEMMVNADLAMYDAKENGRNSYSRYSSDQYERPRMESQMKWASEITQALAEDRFELLAQPIAPLHHQGPTQYELLLRMRDGNGDHIPPGTFIYIAERLGMIQEIDRWVVSHAIDMLAEQRAHGRDLRFEVNLSGHTIGDPALLELIERRLNETGVPPDRLIFEITETAAVSNIARAATFANRLTELGCRFALDDFGAGFGSFYYLKHLPFDYLKIDGEFVRHCATNETDRILISAVVQIAKGMGKRTIAEFVGDQDSVDVLTQLGVDYGQGYFLGRPEPLHRHLITQPTVTVA